MIIIIDVTSSVSITNKIGKVNNVQMVLIAFIPTLNAWPTCIHCVMAPNDTVKKKPCFFTASFVSFKPCGKMSISGVGATNCDNTMETCWTFHLWYKIFYLYMKRLTWQMLLHENIYMLILFGKSVFPVSNLWAITFKNWQWRKWKEVEYNHPWLCKY